MNKPEDWGLDDPTGKPANEFIGIIRAIEAKINALKSMAAVIHSQIS